jgi:hypothetical protein
MHVHIKEGKPSRGCNRGRLAILAYSPVTVSSNQQTWVPGRVPSRPLTCCSAVRCLRPSGCLCGCCPAAPVVPWGRTSRPCSAAATEQAEVHPPPPAHHHSFPAIPAYSSTATSMQALQPPRCHRNQSPSQPLTLAHSHTRHSSGYCVQLQPFVWLGPVAQRKRLAKAAAVPLQPMSDGCQPPTPNA